ncbi:hypothetical protein [Nitrospira sp. Kam-Ns4a]
MSTRASRWRAWLVGGTAVFLWLFMGAGEQPASGFDGEPHSGTFKTWAVGASPLNGFDPHETIDDVAGLTVHVGAPAMVTSMENTCGGFCGLLFWNPVANAFKTYCVTGGFQFALDIDRRAASGAPLTFGGGDTWATVHGNSAFSPYMNFAGSGSFRRWDVSAFGATSIRVDQSNGKVYFGNNFPGQLIELDPPTGAVRKWDVGNNPYFLVVESGIVFATAFADGGKPDQILRLDPATGELKRWTIPTPGFATGGFGMPNSIAKDAEGSLWFTVTGANLIGRLRAGPDGSLGTADDVIDEYTKAGIDMPHAVAASGSGSTLQSFFTEAMADKVSVLTVMAASPTSTTVAPSTEMLTPTASTATPVDFSPSVLEATITPVVTPVASTDPSGIDRFPIPPGTLDPTGMTRVAFPNTVFGSMHGSDHVFEFKSDVIVAPPPPPPGTAKGRMTGGGSVMSSTVGRVTHGFELHCDATKSPNNLQINWGKGNKFHLESLTMASCSDDPAIAPNPPAAPLDTYKGEGTGRLNGVAGATAKWTFTDAGEPGKSDMATIEIKDASNTVVLSVSGTLRNGNHQAHAD